MLESSVSSVVHYAYKQSENFLQSADCRCKPWGTVVVVSEWVWTVGAAPWQVCEAMLINIVSMVFKAFLKKGGIDFVFM